MLTDDYRSPTKKWNILCKRWFQPQKGKVGEAEVWRPSYPAEVAQTLNFRYIKVSKVCFGLGISENWCYVYFLREKNLLGIKYQVYLLIDINYIHGTKSLNTCLKDCNVPVLKISNQLRECFRLMLSWANPRDSSLT